MTRTTIHLIVFQAETYAISTCVKHCLNENYRRKSIDICSDSQAALRALSSVKFRSKLVLECRKLIMRLADANTVRLIWVPGHHDILGNEIADELPREGSTTDLVGPEPALPLTRSLVKSIICDEAYQKHIQYWKNLPKHSKFFLKEPLTRAAGRRFFNMKKSRLRVLVGTITGHFKCKKHLFTISLKESPICDRCHSDEETMYHLVCLCPTLADKRHRILGDYTLRLRELRKLKLEKILEFMIPLFSE